MEAGREIISGQPASFALRVEFMRDPDGGRGATLEESLSWGSLEIWVGGKNLTEHFASGESVDAVHWYLLPVLRWLVDNWDAILYEERSADPPSAAISNTASRPRQQNQEADGADERRELAYADWWQRHCLRAGRDGGLLPNVFICAAGDRVDVSWTDEPLAGIPDHVRFKRQSGHAYIGRSEVAGVVSDLLNGAANYLCSQLPASIVFRRLLDDIDRLARSQNGQGKPITP